MRGEAALLCTGVALASLLIALGTGSTPPTGVGEGPFTLGECGEKGGGEVGE